MSLGKWSLLDIETTGIDAGIDDVIDIGFLRFEGTKLVEKHSSLVGTDLKLSPFITHLTGINQSMIKAAPRWARAQKCLETLDEHVCIAHNAKFEHSFLSDTLNDLDIEPELSATGLFFEDSLYYLALLHPGRSSFNLESFILDYKISSKEEHRGYEDSRDLLKVLLVSTYKVKIDEKLNPIIEKAINSIPSFWFKEFYNLSLEDLEEIAGQIDFQIKDYLIQEKSETLNVSRVDSKFSSKGIQDFFRNEDEVSKTLSGYKHRVQQEQMALKIGQSFSNGIHSMVQAPTGTGKTLGYLVPSLMFSNTKNRPVLISTGTKLLQNQLFQKDLKVAQKVLGLDSLKVTKLIGTTNHYCRAKFEHLKSPQTDLLKGEGFAEKYLEAFYQILFELNSQTSYESMITAEDKPYILGRILENFNEYSQELSLDFKSCLGSKCPYIKDCSYFVGIDEAKKSDVLVGNHALTFQWPSALDRPEYIIFDEAHKIEESASDAYSIEFDLNRVGKFFRLKDGINSNIGAMFYLIDFTEMNVNVNDLRKEFNDIFDNIRNLLSGVAMIIEKIVKNKTRFTEEYWNEVGFRKDGSSLEVSLFNELSGLGTQLESLEKKISPYYKNFEERDFKEMHAITAWSYVKSLMTQIEDLTGSLRTFLNDDEEYCRSIFYHEEIGINLKSIPINIGKVVHERVLENSDSVVFTSATLGSMDGTKGHLNAEWQTGYLFSETAKRFKTGLYLDPVFDYQNNAKVLLSSDLPPIYHSEYVENILEKLIPVLKSLKGRSLLLFSSYKRFEMAREILLMKLAGKLEVFFQGKNKNIIEDFKKSPHAVLVGLESFGEGIDIPGESLSFVYIDKIPDQQRSLVVDSRKKFFDQNLGNSFSEYFMATRARKLTQKLGRLIRRADDKGVILITDPRVDKWKSRTISQFFEYLSPYQIEKMNFEDATKELMKFSEN